ncbi:hypothetical protein B0T26DRAFT_752009 [Lasiosphaeria miniovina]|uniref:Amine oxidase domain-containing protein n=1 Tax=Lasiosphaeria miniovina TaxID=1954250 RepID=A0AA40ALG5_9PEZI|nr:uncharacterized protein B0T26DRAFT_752009 [Lasiosphaeria miniovina]KAK0718028.1 hypothetical protein B0T26DRAFT_752009 [Lasiosphaeria miniovina]
MASSRNNQPTPLFKNSSFRARWAALSLRESLVITQAKIGVLVSGTVKNKGITKLCPIASTRDGEREGTPQIDEFSIAIVGAGVAGLFTAMILNYLNKEYDLNAKYTIFEANKPKRLGGRLYTHKFEQKDDKYPSATTATTTYRYWKQQGVLHAESWWFK